MRLFAIGDLHLPGGDDKPMDVFGPQWDRHFFRISEVWHDTVTTEDVVLIPGDISWAMNMEQVQPDLNAVGALPGRKILIRGNHDYWWSSLTRVREALPEGMAAIQNDALEIGPAVICGTRGWTIPTTEAPLSEADEKIYQRELQRLALSLQAAARIANGRPVIVMLHYPPLYDLERHSGFTDLLEQAKVHTVVYGHLHGSGIRAGFTGMMNGISYHLVSCDSLNFSLKQILIFN